MKNTNQRQNHGEKVSHLRSAPNKGSGQETVLRSFGKQSEKGGEAHCIFKQFEGCEFLSTSMDNVWQIMATYPKSNRLSSF
jgi:hypothetical protein